MSFEQANAQLKLEELREKYKNAKTKSEQETIRLQAIPLKLILRRKGI